MRNLVRAIFLLWTEGKFYVQIQVPKFIPHSFLLHDYFFKALAELGNIILQNIAYSNKTKFENNFSFPL